MLACCRQPRRAAGIADILTLFKTITSTIQNAIGGALSGIQTSIPRSTISANKSIWPVAAINQARAFVTSTRAQYGGLMSQIQAIKNNSATLTNPIAVGIIIPERPVGSIAQLQPLYTNVYATVPPATDARQSQRNMMDMDDALAMGSLKTTVLSDQTTQGMLALADRSNSRARLRRPAQARCSRPQAQVARS